MSQPKESERIKVLRARADKAWEIYARLHRQAEEEYIKATERAFVEWEKALDALQKAHPSA